MFCALAVMGVTRVFTCVKIIEMYIKKEKKSEYYYIYFTLNPNVQAISRLINSEFLGGIQASVLFKAPRGFQCTVKVKKHWSL